MQQNTTRYTNGLKSKKAAMEAAKEVAKEVAKEAAKSKIMISLSLGKYASVFQV